MGKSDPDYVDVHKRQSMIIVPKATPGVDRGSLGIPPARNRPPATSMRWGIAPRELRFYCAVAMFRQAAMSAGLKRRAALDTAVAESARAFGDSLDLFARTGLQLLQGEIEP